MRTVVLLSSLIICSGLGYYVYQDSLAAVDSSPKSPQDSFVSVQVVTSQRCDLDERVDLVGSLEAVDQVQIRSRIIGYLDRLPYDVGDSVNAGEIVVELSELTYQERVSRAGQSQKIAIAQRGAAIARRDLIQLEVQRFKDLARSGVSTEQQQEDAEARLAVAEAEISLEEARVSEARTEILHAEAALSELRIATPIAGIVAENFWIYNFISWSKFFYVIVLVVEKKFFVEISALQFS